MNPQEIDKFIVFIKNLKAEKKTVFTAAHQALNCKAVEVRVVAVREGVKKTFFWEISPKCGWVAWLIPKQGPNP